MKIATNTVAELVSWEVVESVDTSPDTVQGDAAQTHLTGIPGWSASAVCRWDETDTNGQEACTIGASVTGHFQAEGDDSGDDDMTGTMTVTEVGVTLPSVGPESVERRLTFLGNGALSHTTVA